MNYRMELYTIETELGTEWVASYPDFNMCIGQGKTKAEAIAECEENLALTIEFYNEEGKELPVIKNESTYSGKMTLRMSKRLHEKASKIAEENGISLNSFIVESLAVAVGQKQESNSTIELMLEMSDLVEKNIESCGRIYPSF